MEEKNKTYRKNSRKQKPGFHWLVIICLIFCELWVYTWIRIESTQAILRISKAQEEQTQKISYQKALFVERDRLKSDDRITKIGTSILNLSTQTLNQTIYLSREDG
jgi:hypothetical protein